MTGILLVDKEQDWTSSDVVAKLRGVLHERRIGHAGTLDPLATGLLIVMVGRAARASDYLMRHTKKYRAHLRCGIVTDTQDITGRVLSETALSVSSQQLEEVLQRFRGEQEQIPPMYSAIKVGGKKLYEIARRGGEVERRPRPVHIDNGKHNIDWNRTTGWVRENLLNRVSIIEKNDAGTVERTGLHPREFIETRRYTLSGEITIEADDSVSMCSIVEGEGAVITSPEDLFSPFTVHYAETFIIPGSIQRFSIRPLNRRCVLLRATVRN
jgi:tRNA pseudouridine(55) synthase